MTLNAYPSMLTPTDHEVLSIDGRTIVLPKAEVTFKRWQGQPIANTFGGKALVDFESTPMFAELAIMKLFKNSGWEARWIETYGASATVPYHFSNWIDGKLTEQPIDTIQEEHVMTTLAEVASLNGGTYSGCWDVVGWYGGKVLFAESKRAKKDRFRSTQHNWLAAGLKSGLYPNNFLVVEWDFI
jgi:hypothetical protein